MSFPVLAELQEAVASRCGEIQQQRPDWPCRKGCDQCCRNLARLPELRRPEWELLEAGLAELRTDQRDAVRERLQVLSGQSGPPYACPFLDDSSGCCLVYAHRPMACRTYGFYRERDKGLYCEMIRERADSGEFDRVVWGNTEGLDSRMAAMGERIPLLEWVSGKRI